MGTPLTKLLRDGAQPQPSSGALRSQGDRSREELLGLVARSSPSLQDTLADRLVGDVALNRAEAQKSGLISGVERQHPLEAFPPLSQIGLNAAEPEPGTVVLRAEGSDPPQQSSGLLNVPRARSVDASPEQRLQIALL
jgi:hypothetical protein